MPRPISARAPAARSLTSGCMRPSDERIETLLQFPDILGVRPGQVVSGAPLHLFRRITTCGFRRALACSTLEPDVNDRRTATGWGAD